MKPRGKKSVIKVQMLPKIDKRNIYVFEILTFHIFDETTPAR